MTVGELMDRMDSEEVAEWLAYEKVAGPLGSRYSSNKLAEILDELKLANFLFGQVNKEEGKENPIPPPKRTRRPHIADNPPEDEEDDETETGG